jgi:hypothetical protein
LRILRFLGGVATGLLFGWVPPELIAWLRGTPDFSRGTMVRTVLVNGSGADARAGDGGTAANRGGDRITLVHPAGRPAGHASVDATAVHSRLLTPTTARSLGSKAYSSHSSRLEVVAGPADVPAGRQDA